MMKRPLPKWGVAVLRSLPLLLCLVFLVCYLVSGKDVTVDRLLSLIPQDPVLSVTFLLLLYALKSLVAAFPVVILYVAGGLLFPPWLAILINSVGLLVELTVPYGIGRLAGEGYATHLCKRHPRLARLLSRPQQGGFFTVFFLRIIGCLPLDVVSLYLGATETRFFGYLLWSFLGSFPSLVAITLLGNSVTDPLSPAFWLSVGLTVVLSVLSLVLYRRHTKKQNGSEHYE